MKEQPHSTGAASLDADGPLTFRADRYSSEAFQRAELERIFERTWVIVARESAIAAVGDCLPIEVLGRSLLLVRGEDACVRAFLNVCRHRGTRLLSAACTSKSLTCRYHGWRYALDGSLVHVPKQEGFGTLDTARHGLIPVRAKCFAGFVWIDLSTEAPSLEEHLGSVHDRLEPYRLEEMHPLLERTDILPCNWKAVLDQATETYHVQSLHGRSVGRFIDTRAEVVARFHPLGEHHLQVLPILESRWRARVDRLSTPSDLRFDDERMHRMHKYLVFPNTILNVLPYHLTVFRVFPITPDRCWFHYGFYLRRRAGWFARIRGFATLAASRYILSEDLKMLPIVQAGANAAGAMPITFHSEESPLAHFHKVIDDRIGAGPPVP